MKSQIFKAAHKLAKTFEGDYRACFSIALHTIYKDARWYKSEFPRWTFEYCLKMSIANTNQNVIDTTPKGMYNILMSGVERQGLNYKWNIEAFEILEAVSLKGEGFKKDIAKQALKTNRISAKQAWCVVYAYKNVA